MDSSQERSKISTINSLRWELSNAHDDREERELEIPFLVSVISSDQTMPSSDRFGDERHVL